MNAPPVKLLCYSLTAAFLPVVFCSAAVNQAESIAPDVYFHEGDIGQGIFEVLEARWRKTEFFVD